MVKVIRKNKSVMFNIADPDQLKLYEHAAKRTNFSAYIKRLIQRDLEHVISPQKEESPSRGLIEGFI